MATVDVARCRLRLTDPELAAVTSLGQADPATRAAAAQLLRDALTTAGALRGTALPGWVDELLRTVARPALRLVLETVAGGPPVVRQIWATPADAVAGEPAGDGTTELAWIEPAMLPYTIVQVVRLRRDRPPERTATNREAGLLRHRRMSWRASSVWADRAGHRHTGAISVVDAGPAGLWLVTVDDPAADDPMVELALIPASAVWRQLIELLPHDGATDRREAPA